MSVEEAERLRRAADEAEIATWPQHMRDNFRRVSAQRETMKKIAESQK